MRKLDTPLGMLLTVALLAVYATYSFATAAIEDSWTLVAAGVLSIFASVGTALLKPWSRHLVYALSAAFVAKFTYSIKAAADAGYFDMRFDSRLDAALSLLPGFLLVVLSGACCLIVYRHFASRRSHH